MTNPANFDFNLIAAIVAFIPAAFGYRVFHIWKLDLETQISLDTSLKRNSMQRNVVHFLNYMYWLCEINTCMQITRFMHFTRNENPQS